VKKNWLNRLKFWKNQLVRFGFGFISQKTEKTEPNLNKKKRGKKPSQTEKTESNQFEPVFVLKNQTETSRFELISVFLKKKFCFNYIFL
jgi:hypothetical protein